jgi:hemoglobin
MTQSNELLDEPSIASLVDRFYEKVRLDPLLGPVFNAAVKDWDEHKLLLTSFWASVALRKSSYRGNPMAAHRSHVIRAEHFDHWLALWRETTHEVLNEESAARLCGYAERIGRGLRLGLGLHEHPQARPFGISIVGITH